MRKHIGKMAACILAIGLCTSMAACEGQVPQVSAPTSSASASPDLTQAQEKRIRLRILDALEKANKAKDPKGIDEYVGGPQLQIRTSELNIAKASGDLDNKTTIPRQITQTVIPTDSGWPRSIFTITTTTADQQSKRLLVMTQDVAGTNYKLWGVARLFQGAQLPKFAVPTIGSEMGDSSDTGLVFTPESAVSHYADILQNGTSSKYSSDFTSDYFQQDLSKLEQTVQQGMEANNGTQKQTFTAVPGAIKIMRSSDGGDLVVAQIDSVWTRTAGEGRESLPASDDEKALFGNTKATSTIKVTYVNVVAMYVPPAGSGAKVSAVGAERQAIKVEAL
ncbi:MAG: hypothetical protein ABF780_01190 [Bifidobacterium aquikefiri]|uniref:DUF8094 domain-containing protein n=1 Tax=Bifidobacterium aquikefiri TaxID=1653207 RepID=A0A261G940_9BIFI|nr:hypothetical protein [Bifidobacterium aquikefiri]OZG67949.1 hypothetical protein BAQU_0594 [Bifidobacterium aquikefiri]